VTFSQNDFDALPGEDDEFGGSLAAGDFDADGAVDLAIGAPRRDVGDTASAGTVFLVSRMNGAAPRRQVLIQDNLFAGGSESGDRFGYALAAGNFDADNFADLAIGVPFEDVPGPGGEVGEPQPIRNVGEVNVRYGSSNGLAAGSDQQFRQGAGGVEGASEAEDLFGSTLTAWNFGRDHRPLGARVPFRMTDLAIGVPAEDLFNPNGTVVENAGAVNLLYGALDTGLTANGDQFFVQSNVGSFTNVSGDRFGASLY
jgi:hypothetical protein